MLQADTRWFSECLQKETLLQYGSIYLTLGVILYFFKFYFIILLIFSHNNIRVASLTPEMFTSNY